MSWLALAAALTSQPYGTLSDGRAVTQYTLDNGRGLTVRFLNHGGIITSLEVPDRQGRRANVVLGFASLADYEAKNANYRFGAIMGRYVGRIANARFVVDGREVRLQPNDGPHALHGGGTGFDSRLWRVEPVRGGAVLRYTSPAGDQGFPGTLSVAVTYRVTTDNGLRIDYEAQTDAPTHLNLTNHSYFNLAGAGSGTVLDHLLQVRSRSVLETDAAGIPTAAGSFAVAGTPFDFGRPAPLRTCVTAQHPQLAGRRGCNHSWLLGAPRRLRRAARLVEPRSGRTLEVSTTEPSIHVYTAGWIPGTDRGAQGTLYRAHDAVALETQHLPDSPNRPDFPSTLLRPGETFRSTTIYRFGTAR